MWWEDFISAFVAELCSDGKREGDKGFKGDLREVLTWREGGREGREQRLSDGRREGEGGGGGGKGAFM